MAAVPCAECRRKEAERVVRAIEAYDRLESLPKHQRVRLYSKVRDTHRDELLRVIAINRRHIRMTWSPDYPSARSYVETTLQKFDEADYFVIVEEGEDNEE